MTFYRRPRALIVPGILDAQIDELDRDIAALERLHGRMTKLDNLARLLVGQVDAFACVENPDFQETIASLNRALREKIDERDRLDAEMHGEPAY